MPTPILSHVHEGRVERPCRQFFRPVLGVTSVILATTGLAMYSLPPLVRLGGRNSWSGSLVQGLLDPPHWHRHIGLLLLLIAALVWRVGTCRARTGARPRRWWWVEPRARAAFIIGVLALILVSGFLRLLADFGEWLGIRPAGGWSAVVRDLLVGHEYWMGRLVVAAWMGVWAAILLLWAQRRQRSRLQHAGGLLCPYCHYDLSAAKGTTDVGEVRCPECGHLWDARDVRSYWRHELGP